MALRILFVPFGSEGDMNPLFWLAEGLAARWHEAVFLLSPHYARHAEARGHRWFPVGTEEDFHRFARNPELWHAYNGPSKAAGRALQNLLKSPSVAARCREFQTRMAAADPLTPACDWAEQIATGKS